MMDLDNAVIAGWRRDLPMGEVVTILVADEQTARNNITSVWPGDYGDMGTAFVVEDWRLNPVPEGAITSFAGISVRLDSTVPHGEIWIEANGPKLAST